MMFENRVLRRVCGLRGEEIIGVRRKLNYAELYALYSLPSTPRMMKSRRMRWAGY
jgi:hypothetical protein